MKALDVVSMMTVEPLEETDPIYIASLLESAAFILRTHPHSGALWRVVDAAGLLAKIYPGEVGSEGRPTGRGVYIAGELRP